MKKQKATFLAAWRGRSGLGSRQTVRGFVRPRTQSGALGRWVPTPVKQAQSFSPAGLWVSRASESPWDSPRHAAGAPGSREVRETTLRSLRHIRVSGMT